MDTSFPTVRRLSTWTTARRVLVTFAAIATLILLFYAVEDWRGRHAWNKYRTEGRLRGIVFDLDQVVPPPVPPEQNFAAIPFFAPLGDFSRPIPSFPGLSAVDTNAGKIVDLVKDASISRWDKGALVDFSTWRAAIRGERPKHRTPEPEPADQPIQPAPYSEEDRQIAADFLNAVAPLASTLKQIELGLVRPESRFPIHYEENFAALIPHLPQLKRLAQVFSLLAQAELALNQTDAAANHVLSALRLANALEHEPIIISQLVRFSIVRIALGPVWTGMLRHQWNDSQLQQFQSQLKAVDFRPEMRRALDFERVSATALIDEVARDHHLLNRVTSESSLPAGARWVRFWPSGWFDFEKRNYNQYADSMRTLLPAGSAEYPSPATVRKFADELEQTLDRPPVRNHILFTRLLFPAITGVFEKVDRSTADVQLARTACAIERFRLAHGNLPQDLNQLQPIWLESAPLDPVTGGPLQYQPLPSGHYRLYSLGWDGKDDGGRLGAKNNPNPDWVWPN